MPIAFSVQTVNNVGIYYLYCIVTARLLMVKYERHYPWRRYEP